MSVSKLTPYILLLVILGVAACEDSSIIEADLEYREYYVINAELTAGKDFTGVTFTKTLPLNEIYSLAKAELKDVETYLVKNGVQIIPLHYFGDGLYLPLYTLEIKGGETYELFADAGGRKCYARTIVPETPYVTNARFNSSEYYLTSEVRGRAGETYGASVMVNGLSTPLDFHTMVSTPEGKDFTTLLVRTKAIPAELRNSQIKNNSYIKVYAYDRAYEDYFLTRSNNEPVTNPFTSGSGAAIWNVTGDDYIGMFIGCSESDAIVPD